MHPLILDAFILSYMMPYAILIPSTSTHTIRPFLPHCPVPNAQLPYAKHIPAKQRGMPTIYTRKARITQIKKLYKIFRYYAIRYPLILLYHKHHENHKESTLPVDGSGIHKTTINTRYILLLTII